MIRRTIAGLSTLAALALAASAAAAQAPQGCNHSASAPIAFGDGAAAHTLLLFWAGQDCNAAVAGRAVLDADGHAVYLHVEDPNRLRIKEPDVPPHPPGFAPPLAELAALAAETMERTGSLGPYPADPGESGIFPMVEAADWARARDSDRPMMCHSTGYSVEICLWLDPASGEIAALFERGS